MICMKVLKIEKCVAGWVVGCCALIRLVTIVDDHFRDTCDTTSVEYIDGLSRRRENRR